MVHIKGCLFGKKLSNCFCKTIWDKFDRDTPFIQGKRLSKEGKIKGIDLKTCQERCKNKKECGWYSYNNRQHLCLHLENCKGLPYSSATDYVSGQSGCPFSYKRKRKFWSIFKRVCAPPESEMTAQ